MIDTCLEALTLGLRTDDGRTVSVSKHLGVGHAERIAPAFAELCREAGMPAARITRLAVTVGPGSFMGQRVGIAFAKGVALATGAGTVPLTTLEGLAWTAGCPVAVAIDARRGETYLQEFGPDGAPCGPIALVSYADAALWLTDRQVPIIGSGVAASGLPAVRTTPAAPSAEALFSLADRRPPGALRTLYLRAPDARPPRRQPL